jgi:hypothetical protein
MVVKGAKAAKLAAIPALGIEVGLEALQRAANAYDAYDLSKFYETNFDQYPLTSALGSRPGTVLGDAYSALVDEANLARAGNPNREAIRRQVALKGQKKAKPRKRGQKQLNRGQPHQRRSK